MDFEEAYPNLIKKLHQQFPRNEDNIQNTLIKIWKNWDKYDQRKSLDNWALQILKRTQIDNYRSRTTRLKYVTNEIELIEPLVDATQLENNLQQEQTSQLQVAIANLPEELQIVVSKFYFEDKTFQEISEEENIPTYRVKSRLFNARKKLKKNPDVKNLYSEFIFAKQ